MRIEELQVGMKEIDDQHAEYLERLEIFLAACVEGRQQEELMSLLAFLEEYAQIHFSTEENLMVKFTYPSYRKHKNLHAQFLYHLECIKEEASIKRRTTALALRVNKMLIDWFKEHILAHDKKLAVYLCTKMS